MPTSVRKVRKDKEGRGWAVVEKATGKVKSRHKTEAKARASQRYRERGRKK